MKRVTLLHVEHLILFKIYHKKTFFKRANEYRLLGASCINVVVMIIYGVIVNLIMMLLLSFQLSLLLLFLLSLLVVI